jgi:hypothetical protein
MQHEVEKQLPPTPLAGARTEPGVGGRPADTYTRLLEHENAQLRVLNQSLLQQVKNLEGAIREQCQNKTALQDKTERYSEELKRRDCVVAEIAETIISSFRQYRAVVSDPEQESVYSQFEEDSSQEIMVGFI